MPKPNLAFESTHIAQQVPYHQHQSLHMSPLIMLSMHRITSQHSTANKFPQDPNKLPIPVALLHSADDR